MKKGLSIVLSVLLVVGSLFVILGCKPQPVALALWTQEGTAENAFQFVQSLATAYTAAHPNVTFEVVNKETEVLREDFQTASLANSAPDLLWTVNDHVGPFQAADLIQPVEKLFDLTKYADSALAAVKLPGSSSTWGVPVSNGNHLMLLYNKDLVPTPPAHTDELVSMAKDLTKGQNYGLVFNETEPFWLVPWLGGFNGAVFAADGITPTLNTPEMIATLKWYYDLKFTYKIIPKEADYNGADTLFKEGKAAMIINGDWSLGDYKSKMGDKLGVARIPLVTSTGKWPAPYTSGKFFMIPVGVKDQKLKTIKDFIVFATNKENQVSMVKTLNRLPAFKEALTDASVTSDALLKGSADQMLVGTPMPTVLEMRCVWDTVKPYQNEVLAGKTTPEKAAADMQKSTEDCIKAQSK
jgi:arabinogalactan oligomer/maltooligosaccharide transport system substrate-binding protein